MSRGFGKTQIIIANMFKKSTSGWYTTRDLCEAVYGEKNKYTKDEYKTVKRAAKSVAVQLGWRVMYGKLEAGTNFYFDKKHVLLMQQDNISYQIMQGIATAYLKYKVQPKLVHKLESEEFDFDPDQIVIDFIKFMQEKLSDVQKREILYEQYYNFFQSKTRTMDIGKMISESLKKETVKKLLIEGLKEETKEELKNRTALYLIDDQNDDDEPSEAAG